MITYKELSSILDYNPDTGKLLWKYTRSNRAAVGTEAGTLTPDGYISISIDHNIYRAHRLAWLLCFQEWPSQYIDHINGIKNDNRLDNLREASSIENSYNTKSHKDSTTGIKGVYFNKANNNYRAQIRYDGKTKSLGSFKTVEEAALAYEARAIEIHNKFYRK